MDIHEYQAKQILSKYGIAVPAGAVAYTAAEAESVARGIDAAGWAVKAQILAGDRGTAGGVKLVSSPADVREMAAQMLATPLETAQTGGQAETVRRVYVEAAVDHVQELYVGAVVDRGTGRVTLMTSAAGGTAIEAVAHQDPNRIVRHGIDPAVGLDDAGAARLAQALSLTGDAAGAAAAILHGIYDAFVDLDASLIEINPLALTRDGKLYALDAKMSFDDNALFRHKAIADLRDEADPTRADRARDGYNYLKLDGNIGCVVNGAALAMATMDMLDRHGGRPANFLDLPPGARHADVAAACARVLTDPDVSVVLANVVGGGLTRCDAVAEALASAVTAAGRQLPLVVRFEGVNRDLGKKTLRDMGVAFTAATDLADAARKAVRAAGGDA